MIEVIDDFLTTSYHSEILRFVSSGEMQWFYTPNITGEEYDGLGLHGFSNHLYDVDRDTPVNPLI